MNARLMAAFLLVGSRAGAQVIANPSAAIAAMGGTGTAAARGLDAPAWNPAGLGLPGTSAFSISLLLNANGAGGSGPIGMSDLAKKYPGDTVPDAVRRTWLDRVRSGGGQTISGAADLSLLALNIGPVGFSYSATVRGAGRVPTDAAELLLFGNFGYADSLRAFNLAGARLDAAAFSTAALSYGVPLNVRIGSWEDQHFAIGVTAKYMMGHGLIVAADAGSAIATAPVDVDVRIRTVSSDTGSSNGGGGSGSGGNDRTAILGSGIGLDFGVAWDGGPFRVGIALRDIVNSFKWTSGDLYTQTTALRYTSGVRTQDTGPWKKVSALGAAARDSVERLVNPLVVDPSLAIGMTWEVGGRITLAGEFQQRTGNGFATSPPSRFGVGAQWKGIPFLPIRVGYSQTPDANFVTGGLGFDFAFVRLDFAGGVNTRTSGDGTAAVALTFGRH